MKQIKITLSKTSRTTLFSIKQQVIQVLTTVGLTLESSAYENYGDLVFKTGVTDQLKYRMVKSYFVDEFGDKVTVQLIDRPFDFQDYQNTPLDGPEIEGEIQQMLLAFDTTIDNVLVGATTEYKKQARLEIGRLIKDNVDSWIENNESIQR